MNLIWQGPGVLWGTGDPVHPGQPIPDGHVTPGRIGELGDRVKMVRPEPEKKPKPPPSTASDSEFDPQLDPPSEPKVKAPAKRGPGRPPGRKGK